MKPTTAARRSYDKARARHRAEDVARLQRLAGAAPVRVELAASPEGWFVVTVPGTEASCAGRFQIVATWIEGFVACWSLPSGQGLHEGDHAQQ